MDDAPATQPRYGMDDLLQIMAKLRDPDGGCPWDVAQDFASIAPYTIEEAYEVADAIEQADMPALKGELGDLLLQVVFHAQMATEAGDFAYADVVHAVSEKMVKRHPHVFGDASVADADAQTKAWEDQKADERAAKAQAEELDEITEVLEAAPAGAAPDPDRLEDELGDLLFTCVNLARKLGTDPETALRRTNAKFERRFRDVEAFAAAAGRGGLHGMDIEDLESLWSRAKEQERV